MKISLVEMGKTKKRNVREAIIAILSRDYPLNIRKIYNHVKKEYALNVTYQAVFNMVKEMLEDGILEKSGMDYKLNMNWIRQLEDELRVIKKKYMIEEESEIKRDIKSRIADFVSLMGPKIKDYINNDSCCIITLSGTGQFYALNLWKYLSREGKNVKFVEVDKTCLSSGKKLRLNKEDFYNKKVLIVDYGIFSGTIYKLLMDTVKSIKNKFKIKDIKFAVDIDMVGVADFAVVKTSALNSTRLF